MLTSWKRKMERIGLFISSRIQWYSRRSVKIYMKLRINVVSLRTMLYFGVLKRKRQPIPRGIRAGYHANSPMEWINRLKRKWQQTIMTAKINYKLLKPMTEFQVLKARRRMERHGRWVVALGHKKPQWVKGLAALLLIALLLTNPFQTVLGNSIHKQEFFSYHLRDVLSYMVGENVSAETGYYLATNTYEGQLGGDLFGIAEGKNLVMIQMESMQSMVLQRDYYGQELTPVLNQLIQESGTYYFDNFYCQLGAGNTSDAEFAVNHSLFGSIESYTYQLFEDNYFYGLPKVMKEKGYQTAVFHGFEKDFWNRENIYPKLGFDYFKGGDDYISDNIPEIGGGNIVGISDSAFFQQTIEELKSLKQPYYSFLITLSTHNPFGLPESLKEIDLKTQDRNLFGNYLNSVHYSDRCLGEFFEGMKEAGLYDNSIFVLYGDHYGITKADSKLSQLVTQWLGKEYTYDEMNHIPLLIHIPGHEGTETISTSGGQLDILPTISYLMGVEELNTIYLGQNLFTAQTGFAPLQLHMLKGSFIMDDVVFEMSRDGIFKNSKAWNRINHEPLNINDYYEEYKAAKQAVEVSEYYLYNDVTRQVLLEGRSISELLGEKSEPTPLPRKIPVYPFHQNSVEELDEMVDWLRDNPKDVLAVSSNHLYNILKKFEVEYSGKKGVTGAILYVDETSNEEFLEMRSRIIPYMEDSTQDYSKLEYLGYHTIIINPEATEMPYEDLISFAEVNQVDGLIITEENRADYMQLKSSLGVKLYVKEKDVLLRQ